MSSPSDLEQMLMMQAAAAHRRHERIFPRIVALVAFGLFATCLGIALLIFG